VTPYPIGKNVFVSITTFECGRFAAGPERPGSDWNALLRVLIEHQRKSGFVNAGLPVTKRDFERFGVNAKYVACSTKVLEELLILECTRTMGGSLRGRTPNLWRPTFLPRTPTSNDASHGLWGLKVSFLFLFRGLDLL
jgi:hypothetical protein